ncbi:MAG: CDP-alcohol phosphatidyltransferase family protein [Proteobacteria bacterium]|nr:CDP-alcohol phosphatidyltransferase family protein [Pseudomonadota bacterium]
MIINVPNIVTLLRLLVLPFFIHEVLTEDYYNAYLLFLLGSITDFLDGFLARLLNQKTTFGSFFDPIVDKIFLLSSIIVLTIKGLLPEYFCYTILIRDTLVITGTFFFVINGRIKDLQPNKSGKFLIFLEFLIVLLVLYSKNFIFKGQDIYLKILVLLAIVYAIVSLFSYAKNVIIKKGA